jgi:hypothetical protein
MSSDRSVALTHPESAQVSVPLSITDRRVQQCMDEMINNDWFQGRARELAVEWGITRAAAEQISFDASRFLRLLRDAGAIHDRIAIKADEWLNRAESGGEFTAVARLRLEMVGLLGKQGERKAANASSEPLSPDERVLALRKELRDPDDELVKALKAEWATLTELAGKGWER